MQKDVLAATRYAQALFEIARSLHQDEEIEAELESFSAALKAATQIEKFFNSPHLSSEQKRKFLQKIYQERSHEIYGVLLNFFTLLMEKQRFHLIHEIAVTFRRIADEAQGQGVAEIRSVVELDADTQARLVSKLEKLAGYKITVKKEIDPSLIAGVVIRVKNKVIDGSIKHRLDHLKKELTKFQII